MSEPHVTLDPADSPSGKPRDPREVQIASALRAAAERVRAGFRGAPVETVCRQLLDETRAGLPPEIAANYEPDMDELCRVAVAIVRGTLN